MKVHLDLKDTQLGAVFKKVQFPLGKLSGTITKTCLNYYLALQLDTLVLWDNQTRQLTLKCLILDCERGLEPTGNQQRRAGRETLRHLNESVTFDMASYT